MKNKQETSNQDLDKKVQIQGSCPRCKREHVHRENCPKAEKLLPFYEFKKGEGYVQTGWTQ